MKKSLISKSQVIQSLNSIQDLKDRLYKVEKKNDKLIIFTAIGIVLALTGIIAFLVLKENKYEYDLYDDEYFDDEFEDEFEDEFDDEFED